MSAPNRSWPWTCLPLLCCLAITETVRAAAYDPCTGVTPGGTSLIPFARTTLSTPDSTTITNQLNAQFGAPWQYTWGTNLGGSIALNTYNAIDQQRGANCLHGADINLTWTHDALDTTFEIQIEGSASHIQWIQVVHRSHENITRFGGEWSVDPPAGRVIRGVVQENAPFYYNEGERAASFNQSGTEINFTFADKPRISHPEVNTFHGDSTFYLILATWDGNFTPGVNPHTVTLRDTYV
jgi:hypothetical protein